MAIKMTERENQVIASMPQAAATASNNKAEEAGLISRLVNWLTNLVQQSNDPKSLGYWLNIVATFVCPYVGPYASQAFTKMTGIGQTEQIAAEIKGNATIPGLKSNAVAKREKEKSTGVRFHRNVKSSGDILSSAESANGAEATGTLCKGSAEIKGNVTAAAYAGDGSKSTGIVFEEDVVITEMLTCYAGTPLKNIPAFQNAPQ